MAAYLLIASKRELQEKIDRLSIAAMAHSGDGRAIKKQLKEWERLT